MAIGEFDEVGTTVKEFARDDATVVVGTVIDAEMHDELRVTVVATGLGDADAMRVPTPAYQPAAASEPRPVRLVNNKEEEEQPVDNYGAFDVPTAIRNGAQQKKRAVGYPESAEDRNMDYLDIPAFLRRQAD
jgi:cell division protein FtsZ